MTDVDPLQQRIAQAGDPEYHGEPLTGSDYTLFVLAGGVFPVLLLVVTGFLAW